MAQNYAPYGDVLTSYGAETSNYGYAGEWTDGTGLQHLRARYLNTGIGRFISRDTWGGDYNRPMSLNRWGYVEGNPVNLVDPSGYGITVATLGGSTSSGQSSFTAINLSAHDQYIDDECSTGTTELHDPVLNAEIDKYALEFTNEWKNFEKEYVVSAVKAVGARFAPIIGEFFPTTASKAFRLVYGLSDTNKFIFERGCSDCSGLAYTPPNETPPKIKFKNFYNCDDYDVCELRSINLVVHELGHAFENRTAFHRPGDDPNSDPYKPGRNLLSKAQQAGEVPDRPANSSNEGPYYYGFAGPRFIWQQSTSGDIGEEFADMFLGWTYDYWEGDPVGERTPDGIARAAFMDENMRDLVILAWLGGVYYPF